MMCNIKKTNKQEFVKVLLAKIFWWQILKVFSARHTGIEHKSLKIISKVLTFININSNFISSTNWGGHYYEIKFGIRELKATDREKNEHCTNVKWVVVIWYEKEWWPSLTHTWWMISKAVQHSDRSLLWNITS